MKDFPEEMVRIFEALAFAGCRGLLIELSKKKMTRYKVERYWSLAYQKLAEAGMIETKSKIMDIGNSKKSYVELTSIGKDAIEANLNVFRPKKMKP
jgi:predicted DNA-binding ArsR family transcriptional regulator